MPRSLPLLATSAPVCCAPISAEPLDEAAALQLAARLKALADPARLRVLSLVLTSETGEACNCDMAALLGLTDGTVSHHLRVLREAGLVTGERRGTWVYYRAVPEALDALTRALATTAAAGTTR